MANVVVVGMQWGDEGKGKIVDLLGPAFDVVARYQGGHNAGHTVKYGTEHFSLHLVPSGILRPGVQCVLGNGMVISPDAFFEEVSSLEKMGIVVDGRLFLSERAHIILAEHASLDQLREAAAGKAKIGTTARGIGPAYEVKAARFGLRLIDIFSDDIEDRLRSQMVRLEPELLSLGGSRAATPVRIADQCRFWADKFRPYRADTSLLLARWMEEGKRVLFEGAQGTLLDIDHGTYPYVTSSNAIAGGACTGMGVPPTAVDSVVGVLKAYATRVGGGPFPSEDEGDFGEFLRRRGNEYGTTTGRPRRCGWLDLVAARYAVRLNGVECIALTKLDVLDTMPEIPVCTGYKYKGRVVEDFPADLRVLEGAEPILELLPGWQADTGGILEFKSLPTMAQGYVKYLERKLGTTIGLVSTGPRREETIVRRDLPVLEKISSGDPAVISGTAG